jgi:hypothetical protein
MRICDSQAGQFSPRAQVAVDVKLKGSTERE